MFALLLATTMACGGSPAGPEAPTIPRIASVIVRPGVASLGLTESLRFTADVRDDHGRPTPASVTWQASGGQIDSRGLYKAGGNAGEFEVRAISVGEVIGRGRIKIEEVPTSKPGSGKGSGGGSDHGPDEGAQDDGPDDGGQDDGPDDGGQDGASDDGARGDGPDDETQDGGSDDDSGSSGGDQTDTTRDPPQATTLTISPTRTTLDAGQSRQFSVDLRDQYGRSMSDPVQWETTGGTITGTGFFVAGSRAGDFEVTARSAGLVARSTVTVGVPEGQADGVPISPGESIQAAVDAHPSGTTFVLEAGVHSRQSVEPKDGMTFVGEPGAVLDGGGIDRFAFGSYGPGARGVTIKNLEIRNYMTSITEGAVQGDNTRDWAVVENEIHRNGGFGLRGGPGMKVLRNHAHHNGDAGIHGYKADGMLVEGNEVDHNGDNGVQSGEFATAAGMKFFKIRDLVVRNNYVHDNQSRGIWCDTDCIDVVIEGNRVVNNGKFGIWIEISYRTVVRGNHVERNGYAGYDGPGWLGGAGIAVTNSPDIEIAGNTLIDNADGIAGMQASGYPSSGAYGAYELRNLWVHDNTVRMSQGRTGIVQNAGSTAVFEGWNNRFDRNRYTLENDDAFAWRNGTRSSSQWRGYGQDPNGTFD